MRIPTYLGRHHCIALISPFALWDVVSCAVVASPPKINGRQSSLCVWSYSNMWPTPEQLCVVSSTETPQTASRGIVLNIQLTLACAQCNSNNHAACTLGTPRMPSGDLRPHHCASMLDIAIKLSLGKSLESTATLWWMLFKCEQRHLESLFSTLSLGDCVIVALILSLEPP